MYNDLTKLNGVCGGADVTMQHGIYASDVISYELREAASINHCHLSKTDHICISKRRHLIKKNIYRRKILDHDVLSLKIEPENMTIIQ